MQILLYFHCIVSSPLQKQFARNGVNQALGSGMYVDTMSKKGT